MVLKYCTRVHFSCSLSVAGVASVLSLTLWWVPLIKSFDIVAVVISLQ